MLKKLMEVVRDEEGATMVEYALMLALIAAVCIGVVTAIGNSSDAKFGEVDAALQ